MAKTDCEQVLANEAKGNYIARIFARNQIVHSLCLARCVEVIIVDTDKFLLWLAKKKGFGEKAAKDVVSRCNRIERILNLSLDDEVNSSKGLGDLLERIKSQAPDNIREGSEKRFVIPQLRRAAKLYAEYKNSKKA